MRVKIPEIKDIYDISYPPRKMPTNSNSRWLWTCDICHKKLGRKYKDIHLAGNLHAERLALEVQRHAATKDIATPPTDKKPRPKPSVQIYSKTSSRPSPGALQNPFKTKAAHRHPNGELYIQIQEVKAIYNHAIEIPGQFWKRASIKLPNGANSLVTPVDVKAATDTFDTEIFEHDIDSTYTWKSDRPRFRTKNF